LFTFACFSVNQYFPWFSVLFCRVVFEKVELFAHFTRQILPYPASFAGLFGTRENPS
jgi:hypothetical protein